MKRIPVAGPSITQKEIDYVTDAAANAWYADANGYYHRFEKAFADHLGVKHAVSLPSCTSALHLSLAAMNVGPGDEVIVPDLTWIASSAPITYVGATPVFADVDERTWCLSATGFEACITPRTKAVIVVDLYGNMPDYDAIREVASRHNVRVIEDSAEAIGAQYKGRAAGSLGETGAFSFHGSKTLTTGEGGLLATDDDELYARIMFLRDHGRPPGDRFFRNTEVAFKYKMSAMQAAMGLAQLERVNELIEIKQRAFGWYQEELADTPKITLNQQAPDTVSGYWMYTAILDRSLGMNKEQLMAALDEHGIDSRPFFYPLSTLEAYRDTNEAKAAKERNTISYDLSPRGINLPSALNLTQEDVRYVCDKLKEIINAA